METAREDVVSSSFNTIQEILIISLQSLSFVLPFRGCCNSSPDKISIPSILPCHSSPLHIHIHPLHESPLWSSSFPNAGCYIFSMLCPVYLLSLLCTCPNHLSLTFKYLTWAAPHFYSWACPTKTSTSSTLSAPAQLPVFFCWYPLSPNHTSQQISLPSCKPSLALLMVSFCHKSSLTLVSAVCWLGWLIRGIHLIYFPYLYSLHLHVSICFSLIHWHVFCLSSLFSSENTSTSPTSFYLFPTLTTDHYVICRHHCHCQNVHHHLQRRRDSELILFRDTAELWCILWLGYQQGLLLLQESVKLTKKNPQMHKVCLPTVFRWEYLYDASINQNIDLWKSTWTKQMSHHTGYLKSEWD